MRPAPRPLLGLSLLSLLSLAAACSGSKAAAIPAESTTGGAPATPAGVHCASFAGPTATAEMRASLFTALTANEWNFNYCTGSGCASLTLTSDGRYAVSSPSYAGGSSSSGSRGGGAGGGSGGEVGVGAWNLAAIDGSRGVLCLDGSQASPTHAGGQTDLPSVLHVQIVAQSVPSPQPRTRQVLQLGGNTLYPGASLTRSSATAEGLPDVKVSPAFAALVGTTWVKANAFDTEIDPKTIAIDASGLYYASFTTNACPATGALSIDRDLLAATPSPTTCTGAAPAFTRFPNNVVPGFFDEIVVLGASAYRRADKATGRPNAFVFDPYGHSVRIYGSYEGVLTAGAATKLELAFENTDPSLTRTMGTFAVTLQPATLTYGQALSAGKLAQVGTLDLAGMTLAPGEKKTASLAITPPASGDTFALAMRVAFADASQKYDGGHTFITAIH